jgi:hypothetical protein
MSDSKIRFSETQEPETPAQDRVYMWFDENEKIFKKKTDDGIATRLVTLNYVNDSVLIYGNDGTSDQKVKTNSSGELIVDASNYTQPVSATALPLPSGASTEAKQDAGNTTLSSIETNQTDGSQKTQIVQGGNSVSVKQLGTQITSTDYGLVGNVIIHGQTTGSGGGFIDVKVSPSGAVQIGGTIDEITEPVAATQSGTWNLQNITGTVSLPTGASTDAKQDLGNASLSNIDANIGAKSDAVATTDTGSFSVISFIKRGLENWTTLLDRIPALVSGRIPVDGSGVTQPVSGPLTNTQLRESPVPSSVAVASSATILNLTTAALGSNWTAFSSQSCTSLDIVNNTSIAIEYRRNGSGNPMQITSGAGRLVVGITNANQIEVRRVDLSDTQVIIQAEAITV